MTLTMKPPAKRSIKSAKLPPASRQAAFTLIEMMAVLSIISILAAFAFPSYRQIKLKTARAEGRSALMRLMQQQERYYSEHHRYRHFSGGDGNGNESDDGGDSALFRRFSGASGAASAYRLEAQACGFDESGQSSQSPADAQHCLLLRATPANGFSDPACDVLTLDNSGKQSATGSAAADGPGACW
jgi:type IV pilus assembly protein PilE